jgi:transposase-like protein
MTNLSDPIFHDEDKAREYLEAQRWPDGPYCPFCGQFETVARLPEEGAMGKGWLHCSDCRKKFTVRVGSVYERSHIPLRKWVFAIHLMCASKKGVSPHQLHRMLGITYKSAWFLAHRIRESMKDETPAPLGGEGKAVEVDETYISRKRPRKTDAFSNGVGWEASDRGYGHKRAIVSLVERGGRVISFHVPDSTSKTIRPIVMKHVDRASRLQTDEASQYVKMGREFQGGHGAVGHAKGEYVRGKDHTNTIEGVFSIFKRGMVGIYQHCGEQHLQRYVTEFDFRYNHRKVSDAERRVAAIKGAAGKRLTYRRTDNRPNE